ncbi:MAG: hypothetical protein IKO72_03815 [Kiritimatiellae bacterium]|nr:hypothetical protein [Kiritimatiellia bacterium]
MNKSKEWWYGFSFGTALVSLLSIVIVVLVVSSRFKADSFVNEMASRHLMEGAFGSFAAIGFTIVNVVVTSLPFLIGLLRREYFSTLYSFCRRLPTTIGMLGTLWSLLASDMANPGSLAQKFSIAIVSTFIGLILKIGLEGLACLPYFKRALDGDLEDDAE